MAGSVKIASFWRLKVNIALFENLYIEKGYTPNDCVLGIPFKSGFYVHAYHKDRQQRFKAFLPESAVISMRDLLPNLHMRILDSQTLPVQSTSQGQELLIYHTPIPFYSCSGMNAADLLVNHFTEPEMRDLIDIMQRNLDKYPNNTLLCDGLVSATRLLQNNDMEEIERITEAYASPLLHLHNGTWRDMGQPDENDLIQRGKLDIFVNFHAEFPFLIRLSNRLCKQSATPNITYPYSGNQVRTIYITMSAEDFLGTFLYPMELSSKLFREHQYEENFMRTKTTVDSQ